MLNSGNRYTDRLLRVHALADLTCSAMLRQAFVSLMEVSPDGNSFVSIGGWAGGQPKGPSRASFVATSKAAELFYCGDRGKLSLTPIPDFEFFSTGWQGGARLNQNIVGVSKWEQQHDLLLALILLYSFEWETRLHHIGWRMESEETWRTACEKENAAGFKGIELPADDHWRMYYWHPDIRSSNGGFHTEYQFFPEGKKSPAIHIDVATSKPDDLLRFVADAFNSEPIFWTDDPNGPYGVVWVTGDDGTIMGVMARDQWKRLVPKVDLVDAQRLHTSRP